MAAACIVGCHWLVPLEDVRPGPSDSGYSDIPESKVDGANPADGAGEALDDSAGVDGTSPRISQLAGCPVFSPGDDWTRDISTEGVDSTWTARIRDAAPGSVLFSDVDSAAAYSGIPINIVPATQPLVPITFDQYADESDPGPYPFPSPDLAVLEGGDPRTCKGDCHLLVVQQGSCLLFEGYACRYEDRWICGCGARWDLKRPSYGQRPFGWTSADSAGMPIAPGLVRYDEVAAGAINHALRFSMACPTAKYVRPATHFARVDGCEDREDRPPMGMRLRLRRDYDLAAVSASVRPILQALQRHGMILSFVGPDLMVEFEMHSAWGKELQELKRVSIMDFEVLSPGVLQP